MPWISAYRIRTEPKGFWRENGLILLILVVALALRLFVLFTEGGRMFLGTDDDNYRESAEILLHHGVLTYAGWREPTVFIMPGYPIFLAAIFAAVGSTSWLAARIVQVLISLVAVWFAVKIGAQVGGKRAGIVTGGLMAVYPPNLTSPCFLMTETVFTALMLGCLFCFIRAENTGRAGWYMTTGVMLGLATYIRPTSGVLPAVFGVYLLLRRHPLKRVVFNVAIMGAVVVACLSPWIVRNYMLYKEFIPFTVSGGNPFLRGTYLNERINEKFPWVEGNRILSDKAQMEYGKKRFIAGFRSDFKGYLYWYTVGKFTDFWINPYYYRALSYLPADLVVLMHRLLLVFGTAGALVGLWRRSPPVLLFILVSGYFTVLHMLYLTGPRYSYPLMPLVIVVVAYLVTGSGRLYRK